MFIFQMPQVVHQIREDAGVPLVHFGPFESIATSYSFLQHPKYSGAFLYVAKQHPLPQKQIGA
jgi:hypothetical protein